MPSFNRFNGARLREVREARALTAVSLADMIGKSSSTISQYESDGVSPPAYVVAKLGDVLNVPTHFFTQPHPEPDEPFLFWRSRSAATKIARKSAERKYEWLRRLIDFLTGYVEFPTPNVPVLVDRTDPSCITQAEIERAATSLRRHWNLGDGPISDVVQLVENNGGIVTRTELGDEKLDAYSDWTDSAGRYFIVLSSDKDSAVRSRHDIAHELAHGVLHQCVPANVGLRTEHHKAMESQAARFASSFLMPESTFPGEVFSLTLDGLLELKRRWRVAISSMVMRLSDLGILDDDGKRRMMIQMSRRGWTKREPFDDELEAEKPRLLRRALDTLIKEGVMSAEKLTSLVHLYPSDIERLLGLSPGHLKPTDDDEGPLLFDGPSMRISDYFGQASE